jgi:hypothetical protein
MRAHFAPHLLATAALAVAWAAPVSGATIDINGNIADREVNEDAGLGGLNGTSARIGRSGTGNTSTNGRAGVYVFLLPTLAAGEVFDAATLKLTLQGNAADGNGNFKVDLYGLGRRASADVLGTDYYEGALDTTDATLIADDFITTTTAAGTLSNSSAALVNYLNAQYGPTGAGQYVFFRLNVDTPTDILSEPPPGSGSRAGYQVATADNSTAASRPLLTVSSVPEPASLGLLAAAAVATVGRRRRRP